ncbi:MAG: hypothetical protein ABSG16_20150 [Candidatus Acidiferrum sp.]
MVNNPVPGNIEVTFEREPDFFVGSEIRGAFNLTIAVRDLQSGKIVGIASRSVTKAFVNGVPSDLGYLSDLRLSPEYRSGSLLARGYRFLKELHADGRALLYTTAIFAENSRALATLTAGRAGLPTYHPMGCLDCSGINLGRTKPPFEARCDIERGSLTLLPQIVECLNRNNARKQFAPFHTCEDFLPGGRWRDFTPTDFYVAMRDNRVMGVIGQWNQRRFKQTRIIRFSGPLRWLAPMVKLAHPILKGRRFPEVGEELRSFYVSFVAVDNDDVSVFRALLRVLYRDAAAGDAMFALTSLHQEDPLRAALADYSLTPFCARIFCVCYGDGNQVFENLDNRVPYMEAATL